MRTNITETGETGGTDGEARAHISKLIFDLQYKGNCALAEYLRISFGVRQFHHLYVRKHLAWILRRVL